MTDLTKDLVPGPTLKVDGCWLHQGADEERQRTTCLYGHSLDGMTGRGKRYCKTCNRQRAGYF